MSPHRLLFILQQFFTTAADLDYDSVVGQPLVFGLGDTRVCHTVNITDDNICEIDPDEQFFSNLSYVSGLQPITIDPARTTVIIDDSAEPECGKCVAFLTTLQ